METQHAINEHLQRWNSACKQYRSEFEAHSQAKALYEHNKAQHMRRSMMGDPPTSKAAAEVLADADEDLYALNLERLKAEAAAESTRKFLDWCRAKSDALRSEHVDERMASQLYADRGPGA